MKKIAILLCLLLCITGFAQNINERYEGSWIGTLSVNGSELELVFHVGDGCTLDVPAQGAKGIAAEFIEGPEDSVKIRVPKIWAYFEGEYSDDKIAGTFFQSGMQFPLTLLHEAPKTANRPQTPVEPFPYHTEEVRFANGSALLSGTLTTPSDVSADTPVILLISGSGAQNRDEELVEHRPFAVIADVFARAGIASLRYDDRGFAKSTGDMTDATTDTLAADAAAGIAYLRGMGYGNVGALGHSEGGTIVFMLAADEDSAPDFIISMAGGIEPGEQTLFAQAEAQSLASGMNAEQAKFYAAQVVAQFRSAGNPWINRFMELDPAEYIKNTKCRVLAINGEKDMQVLADRNIPLLQELLPSAETRIYPGLNHLFQSCTTGMPSEYYDIEETISPVVLEDMIDWIKQ